MHSPNFTTLVSVLLFGFYHLQSHAVNYDTSLFVKFILLDEIIFSEGDKI